MGGSDSEEGEEGIRNMGFPVIVVWNFACKGKKIVVSLLEMGRPTVQVWEVEDI